MKNNLDLSLLKDFKISEDLPIIRGATPATGTYDIAQLLDFARQVTDHNRFSGFRKWFVPGSVFGIERLPKHRAFLFAGKLYRQRFFSAANRVGKTLTSCYEDSLHATGLYPDWWEGKRFDKPTNGWVAGNRNETTRDILQKELLGPIGAFGTGMIPKELILDTSSRPGVPGAVGTVQVRHAPTGGVSLISFKSYEQGREAFEGTEQDWIHLDELPDLEIYSECFLRTMTTKGLIYVTATAKQGLTPLVLNFYYDGDFLPIGLELPTIVKLAREQEAMRREEALKNGEELPEVNEEERRSKAVIVAGWSDAPWLSEEDKREQAKSIPAHHLQAATTGLPGIGSGSIYTTPLEDILVKGFPIPKHWKRIASLDVGWNNTAALLGAIDPDTDTIYLIDEYKRGKQEPVVHASAIKKWGDWVPVEIDPASRGRAQDDGRKMFNLYRKEGLNLIPAKNNVESGIELVSGLLATGRLRVFNSLHEWQKEYVTYHRNENGKIVKENDHLMDCTKYLCFGRDHARTAPTRNNGLQGGNYGGRKYGV